MDTCIMLKPSSAAGVVIFLRVGIRGKYCNQDGGDAEGRQRRPRIDRARLQNRAVGASVGFHPLPRPKGCARPFFSPVNGLSSPAAHCASLLQSFLNLWGLAVLWPRTTTTPTHHTALATLTTTNRLDTSPQCLSRSAPATGSSSVSPWRLPSSLLLSLEVL